MFAQPIRLAAAKIDREAWIQDVASAPSSVLEAGIVTLYVILILKTSDTWQSHMILD